MLKDLFCYLKKFHSLGTILEMIVEIILVVKGGFASTMIRCVFGVSHHMYLMVACLPYHFLKDTSFQTILALQGHYEFGLAVSFPNIEGIFYLHNRLR